MLCDALDLLPYELWILIAEQTSEAWLQLSCTILAVGRYSLGIDVQTRMMNLFVNSEGYLPNGFKHGLHKRISDKLNIVLHSRTWHYRGKLHRNEEDMPTGRMWVMSDFVTYLIVESWHQHGLLHRNEDQPAVVSYHKDGTIHIKHWYQNGKLHRDADQPATVSYRKDDTIRCELWYRHGKKHRSGDLPAVIECNEYGSIEKWYQNGELYRSRYLRPH